MDREPSACRPLPSVALARNRDAVARTIHEAGGRDIRVFGSVARGEDTPQSDVDLLVRLPDPMGMIALVGLEQALEDLLGVPVHIVDDWGDGRVLAEAREQAVAL